MIIMQSLTLQSKQPEPANILVETPVQEMEKSHPEMLTRQNTCAMDMIGLSWIFVEDDY